MLALAGTRPHTLLLTPTDLTFPGFESSHQAEHRVITQPIVSAPVFSMQGFQFGALLERLREREELRFGTSGGVLVAVDEVCSTSHLTCVTSTSNLSMSSGHRSIVP